MRIIQPHQGKLMDPRRLKHLVALADHKNFGRAADKCHLSQSAFSRSIQAAEDELGLRLFERSTVDVRCTPAGQFVVERARKLLFENNCLERDIRLYREKLMGDLAFGVGPYPAATIVPALLVELRARHPGVNLRVEVNTANHLAEHLRAEELDFYVADLRTVPVAADLFTTQIGFLEAGMYVRPGHPVLSGDAVSVAGLLPYGLASVLVPEAVRLQLGSLAGLPAGTPVQFVLECNDLNLLKTATMASDTVLACPIAGAAREVAEHQLVRVNVAGLPPLGSNLGLVCLKGRSYSPMAQLAVDSFVRLAAAQATGP
jgi:DNA-binding transcriptional LysR family regulator